MRGDAPMVGRPMGDIALALKSAAATPATVREVCQRAQVGVEIGRKTASRMVQRGDLLVVDFAEDALRNTGPGRPPRRVVSADAVDWAAEGDAWLRLQRSFWDHGSEIDEPGRSAAA